MKHSGSERVEKAEIGHFTVMDGNEAGGDLALIQIFLLCYVNQLSCSYAN